MRILIESAGKEFILKNGTEKTTFTTFSEIGFYFMQMDINDINLSEKQVLDVIEYRKRND